MTNVRFSTSAVIADNFSHRQRQQKLLAFSAFGAVLAAMALLWATPVRSQEIEPVIHPGAMAVSGFPGTTIPGFEDGWPPASIRSTS
ncbi:MAG: hypothetical protein IPL47_09375 [Phyllobacteriaceae bacterium]|nr:hypothetical protein [Phyllobacteriaceae bacterium]